MLHSIIRRRKQQYWVLMIADKSKKLWKVTPNILFA